MHHDMREETAVGHDGERIRSLAREAIRRGLNVRVGATGVSMFPYIWPGSKVTMRPLAEDEEPQKGAVIVIDRGEGDRFILHRLTRRQGAAIVTRGDSNATPDRLFDRRDVLGIVTHVEGRFFKWRRGIPPDGGAYWRIMKALAPLSYAVNRIAANVAMRIWQAVCRRKSKKIEK